MAFQRGFTLVELVAVVVLLGVLSVSIAPRFSGNNSAEVLVLKDQLISAIRFTQQKAMFDNQRCYRLALNANSFAIQVSTDSVGTAFNNLAADSFAEAGIAGSQAQTYYDDANPTVEVGGIATATPVYIWFDGLGNSVQGALNDCRPATLQSTIEVTLNGEFNRQINICSTGYATEENC